MRMNHSPGTLSTLPAGDREHALRTPVAVIREFAAILRDGLAGPVSDAQRACLETILARADELAALVSRDRGAERVGERPRPRRPAVPIRAPRILIVDDDPHVARMTELRLAAYGYAVELAADGAAALALAEAEPPDLVLLDRRLPGLDGAAVLAALKALPALRAVPVIFLSADSASTAAAEARALGAAGFVEKPYRPETLLAAIERALDGRGSR